MIQISQNQVQVSRARIGILSAPVVSANPLGRHDDVRVPIQDLKRPAREVKILLELHLAITAFNDASEIKSISQIIAGQTTVGGRFNTGLQRKSRQTGYNYLCLVRDRVEIKQSSIKHGRWAINRITLKPLDGPCVVFSADFLARQVQKMNLADLKTLATLLLIAFEARSYRIGELSVANIAKRAGYCERAIKTAVRNLELLNLIEIHRVAGRASSYALSGNGARLSGVPPVHGVQTTGHTILSISNRDNIQLSTDSRTEVRSEDVSLQPVESEKKRTSTAAQQQSAQFKNANRRRTTSEATMTIVDFPAGAARCKDPNGSSQGFAQRVYCNNFRHIQTSKLVTCQRCRKSSASRYGRGGPRGDFFRESNTSGHISRTHSCRKMPGSL
jgi:hypothetical protein